MRIQPRISSAAARLAWTGGLLGAFALANSPGQAATVFLESGGRVVMEAEHFDSRVDDPDGHKWLVVPTEGKGSASGSTDFQNARSAKYIQSIPDTAGGGVNHNSAGGEDGPPSADYKVKITTTGTYRLWLKWSGYDGSADSIYAKILEISSPSHYRFSRPPGSTDFNAIPFQGDAGLEKNDAGQDGLDVPATFNITTAGTYTVRIAMREDGSAVDTILLQLQSLPDPVGIGPAESQTDGNTLPVVAPEITVQPVDTTAAEGTSASFTVGVKDNIVPFGIKWFKNDTEIAGANDLILKTPPVIAGDTGAKYKVTLSNSAGQSVTSSTATLSVVENKFQTGVLQYDYFPGSTRQAVEAGGVTPSSPGTQVGSDASGLVSSFESGVNFADNYANRFSGYFIPPTTGNYIFFISGDDDSDLFLSTDDNPSNKKLIAQEVSWSNSRQWLTAGGGTSTPEAKRSDSFDGTQWPGGNTIKLTAGKRYYLEGVHHEGTGGDDFGATYKLDTEDDSLVDNGMPSRFTGSVVGVLIPQVIALSGANFGFDKFTFNVTDVGPSVVDPASARVTIDGQTFTPASGTKTPQGVTAFTYAYPSRLAQGSTHNYSVTVRDTQGRTVGTAAAVLLPVQWFPTTDLPGPNVVDKA